MIFKLDKYYKSTRQKYVFIDSVMNINKEDKAKFLKSFGISYDSFRVEKSRNKVNNDNAERLLEYYGFLSVSPVKKGKYEKCINNMYYAIYFREQDNIHKCIEELNACIADNNCLKPVFILFKIYGIMNTEISIEKIRNLINNDLNYILFFRKNYFIDEFELIYESILVSFKYETDLTKLSNLSLQYPALKWIYLFALGSLYYMKGQDQEAYRCYKRLEEEFEATRNSERLMIIHSNMCFIHNALEEYATSIDLAKKSIEYIYSSKQSIWVSNILMHYVFSNFMLSRYKIIIDFYTEEIFNVSRLNWITASICILASFLNKELNKAHKIIELFRNNEYVAIVLEYINTGNLFLLYELKQTPYIVKIIKKLT